MTDIDRIKRLAGIIDEAEIHDFGIARRNKELALKQQEILSRAKYAYLNEAAEQLSTAMEYTDEAYQIIRDAEEETHLEFSTEKDKILAISNNIAELVSELTTVVKK